LKWAGVEFEERIIPLGDRGARPTDVLLGASPTGLVPVLTLENGVRINDSLAICQWAAETKPDAGLWPKDPNARAQTWSAVCEMHSGFVALRRDLPMNVRRRTGPRVWGEDTERQISRVLALWGDLKSSINPEGPWLNGVRPGIVDAFYAPVATRLRTYAVPLTDTADRWTDALFTDASFATWDVAAAAETWTIGETDAA
jgi:glutathione S-transferase